ncbi:hypothetical protein H109_02987 [Trichophyton interdigitale MR816]|uniref:Uncharacterized protein n=1 Tax=Trichophyton interdigitale (strain MR816) TaxID=1215338 RepID=A0A059JBP9_TRIIM|nr:hypothetical protein H101_04556 [Trichophyton interdigitale H6]KDB25189.1 hypothetical protein H109_02987 [Trichophyton interdigitale MR816]
MEDASDRTTAEDGRGAASQSTGLRDAKRASVTKGYGTLTLPEGGLMHGWTEGWAGSRGREENPKHGEAHQPRASPDLLLYLQYDRQCYQLPADIHLPWPASPKDKGFR